MKKVSVAGLALASAVLVMVSASFVLAGPPAAGADGEGRELARRLVEVTGAAKQFDAVVPAIFAQLGTIILQQAPGKQDEVNEILARLVERFGSRKGELLDEIADIYAARVSKDDMRAAIAYFSSESGQRLVASQPEILKDSMAAGQRWGEKIGNEIQTEMLEELKKRGIKL